MLIQKRMTVVFLETACEALLLSVVLIVLSGPYGLSQWDFVLRDLAFVFLPYSLCSSPPVTFNHDNRGNILAKPDVVVIPRYCDRAVLYSFANFLRNRKWFDSIREAFDPDGRRVHSLCLHLCGRLFAA